MSKNFPYKRVVVVGSTGSGKTFFARRLSARLGIPHVELDSLFWAPDWTPKPIFLFLDEVENLGRKRAWIADGNYTSARDILWPRAQVILWLDYGFWFTFGRLLRRTFARIFSREELWNGNRENALNQLKVWSKDSLIHWFLKTFWQRRREIPEALARPEFSHLKLIRLRSPREADGWINEVWPRN